MTEQVRGEYVMAWMPKVEEMAREMNDGSLTHEDLCAEGCVGLSSAMRSSGEFPPDDQDAEDAVSEAMKSALEERKELTDKDDKLIVQVELLGESINRLTSEYGRKPNVDELANDLGIQQDKVLDILKLTGEDTGEDTEE